MKKYTLINILLFIAFSNSFGQNSQILSKINYYKQSLSTDNKTVMVEHLIMLGNLYKQIDSTDQAIYYYKQALDKVDGTRNYTAIMQLSNYLGFLYSGEKRDYATAEKYFSKAYNYAKKTQDRQNTINILFNLANTKKAQGKYQEALKDYKTLLGIVGMDNLFLLKKIHANMAEVYKALGDQQGYDYAYKMSVSIDSKIKAQQLRKEQERARLQAERARRSQLELQLREAQLKRKNDSLKFMQELSEKNKIRIELLEKEKRLKDLEMQKREAALKQKEAEIRAKKTIISSLVLFMILILIASLFIFKLYKDKKKANEELAKLYEQLKKEKQKVDELNKRMTDSIRYASKIQQAILPSKLAIESSFEESFILYKPRDVVSGDFYWYTKVDDFEFIAGVDCTGHSVPGAFMSMIGYTLLNEIVNAKRIIEPDKVLLELHKGVLKMLHKKDGPLTEDDILNNDDELQDGMAVTLLRINKKQQQITYSIADQKMIGVSPEGKANIYEGDIFAIGDFSIFAEIKFTAHEISYKKGSFFYLFSDGYTDQFSDKTDSKFSLKRFKKLLEEIHSKPAIEQERILLEEFEKWKGKEQQLDDIMIIGIKL